MTTCGKCGTENAPGDAFCGSCGAFLEFAAEEAAEEAGADAGTSVTPDATPAAPPTPAPGPATSTAGDAPAGTGAAAGPTCASCGRTNPAGRTFCVSCGERLAAGATTAAAAATSPSSPAGPGATGAAGGGSAPGVPPAGPRGPAKPDWSFPTAPVPVQPPAPTPGRQPSEPRGRSRLPIVVGLIVLVVAVGGGLAFVAGGGLGGGGSAGPTTAPAATGSAAASPGPATATQEPPATGEPSPGSPTAAPPTVPPGPSVGLRIAKATASSRLAANRAAGNVRDGSPASAWLSKARAMEGAWVEVTFAPAAVTRIQIWAGWQRDEPRYYGNHRPRNVTVSFDGGEPVPLALQDVLGAQRVDIPAELGIVAATRLRIAIVDTYPSRATSAGGSPSKSVAISEIRLFGVPVTP